MNLPSREECILWLKELGVFEHIFAHIMQVNRIAVYLAKKLREKGVLVNVELVDCGSLVHDIDKHLTLKSGGHGIEGKRLVEKKGYPLLAKFCVTHLFTFPLKKNFPSIEHKIVYYADKRVNGDKIVALKERFAYLESRYGVKSRQALKQIKAAQKPCMKIEKELFKPLDISPELSELLGKTTDNQV